MTARKTTMDEPIHLPDPTMPPAPAPGCDVCVALDVQRAEAEAAQDYAQATACEQEIREHPHGTRA